MIDKTEFDVLVLGGGTGNKVASAAADDGTSVALVEKSRIGGICVNRGCNPSKMLIQRANVAEQIRQSDQFHIDASIDNINFTAITNETETTWREKAEQKEANIRDVENLTLYKDEATFVDERACEVNGDRLTAEKVVVATGARPFIPSSIDGLDDVAYITSDEALYLEEQPDHLVIIGGGYVAAEMAHFYHSMGTDVTMLEMMDTLLPRGDVDVRETFTEVAATKYTVHTGTRVTLVSETSDRITVQAEAADGETIEVTGDDLLVAAGRKANADVLNVEAAGIDTDDSGNIETNEYLETTAENVWAFGDVISEQPFKHAANLEATYVVKNAFGGQQEPVDYTGMSHAIFASPQVASLGRTEEELDESGRDYVTGRHPYKGTAMGTALKDDTGFVKVFADPENNEILGCHIIGPEASALIHEVVVAVMAGSGTTTDIANAIYIHPALSEVVQRAFADLS